MTLARLTEHMYFIDKLWVTQCSLLCLLSNQLHCVTATDR